MMIFKRGVFESRRKNKAVFRPKIRINLKEAQSVSPQGLLWNMVLQYACAIPLFLSSLVVND